MLSPDDELLVRLTAPPDIRDGIESLAYWRGRRTRLPWYRRGARREASRMVAVWEQRVRAALVRQRRVPLPTRMEAARLIATGHLQRWLRRAWVSLAAATMLALALAPALLVLELLLKVL